MKFSNIIFAAWYVVWTAVLGLIAFPAPFISKRWGWAVLKTWSRLMMFGQRVFCGLIVLKNSAFYFAD